MGKNKGISILNIILTLIIILLIAAIAILIFVVSPMTVSGESMLNTLESGERIWIQKNVKDYNIGDIIVFKRSGHNENVVKRVIAKAGDTVKFDPTLGYIVNGEVLKEDYIKSQTYPVDYFYGDKQDLDVYKWLTTSGLIVGEGEFFVLGDNREVSYDSHRYGTIKFNEIKGKVL